MLLFVGGAVFRDVGVVLFLAAPRKGSNSKRGSNIFRVHSSRAKTSRLAFRESLLPAPKSPGGMLQTFRFVML